MLIHIIILRNLVLVLKASKTLGFIVFSLIKTSFHINNHIKVSIMLVLQLITVSFSKN